jgi:hypothetical protein
MQIKLLVIVKVSFDMIDQLLITLYIRQILEEKWECNETVQQLFRDFKKAYDSVRREVLYNNLTEFGLPMKLVRLIRMCLNETYNKVRIGKHCLIIFYPEW